MSLPNSKLTNPVDNLTSLLLKAVYLCKVMSVMSDSAMLHAVILEPPKIKSDTISTVSPSISHEVMGPDKEYGNREAWCAVVPGVAELDMA